MSDCLGWDWRHRGSTWSGTWPQTAGRLSSCLQGSEHTQTSLWGMRKTTRPLKLRKPRQRNDLGVRGDPWNGASCATLTLTSLRKGCSWEGAKELLQREFREHRRVVVHCLRSQQMHEPGHVRGARHRANGRNANRQIEGDYPKVGREEGHRWRRCRGDACGKLLE
ncbi:hypothetical protein BC629DRAFT_1493377 [Irpex lacteus]|nr:hypothetical protein BC629DRAFT_1493377 [Irpex lacteus]